MRKFLSRSMALILTLCMLVSMCVVAISVNAYTSETHTTFSSKTSTIAPGVTQSINYAYATDGEQMVYYVATADVTRDDVIVQTSFMDQYANQKFGMQKLSEQMAYADQLYTDSTSDRYISDYYKTVAGVNASFYNMTTGQPLGYTVLDGYQIGESSSYPQVFAILEDGSAVVDYTANIDTSVVWQAVAGSQMIVYNGEDVTADSSGSYNTTRHSRTCVGITEDGKVVMMVLDGRQSPFSCGGTMHELAQIMLEQGCVAAINLDGGGSTTFIARQEGDDEVSLVNRPSDGSERSISSGLIIASLTPPSDTFDHAVLEAESAYITPGSSITVNATGVSPAGTAAEIPEDITYEVVNGTYNDGVFTAGDTTGEATISAVYNGEVVGETTINVVLPDTLSFASSEMVVPYGKSTELNVEAKYGVKEVSVKAEDFEFQLSDENAGTISGFTFTACEESENASTGTEVTATFVHDESVVITANITIGKGSEVVYDFEDNTTQGILFSEPAGTKYNYVWPESSQWVVDEESGQVHSGENALAMDVNYGNSLESGYMKTSVLSSETRVFENALKVGAWIYIPDEAVGLWARWTLKAVTGYNDDGTPIFGSSINGNNMDSTAGGTGVVYTFDEPGWHYLSVDTSAYDAVGWAAGGVMMQFYISDRDGTAYNYVAAENSNIPSKYRFYLDDITVDYSTAVDDREAPVFSNVTYATSGMPDAVQINDQTIETGTVTFAATVTDDTTKSNSTGLDVSTIKAYIDGVEVEHSYSNNIVTVEADSLTNGKHTIKFSACDKMGNYNSVYKYITVDAEENQSTVKLVPQDETLDRILLGSIYNMDLVATAIEDVKSVEVVIDLDNNSVWQLNYMTVADGFEATYDVEETENIATITVTRTGDNSDTGEKAIATLPVRTWELKTGYTYPNGTKQGKTALTYAEFKFNKEFWRMSVIANVDKGILTRVDDTVGTFTGERVFCDTEMWGNYAAMSATTEGLAYYNAWDGGHIHSAEAVDDVDATCTETGYTGRTFCEVCNSVADWGTTVPATGHTYSDVDGTVKCECGELLNGEYEGKYYADGVALNGWVDSSYYEDGVMYTGVKAVEGVYYNFGDNGISTGEYTGLFTVDGATYYAVFGVLTTGWYSIDVDGTFQYMCFDETTFAAYTGVTTIDGKEYTFDENGYLTRGAFVEVDGGVRYYVAGKYQLRQWIELEEGTYWCDGDGFVAYGNYPVKLDAVGRVIWHAFGDDGVLDGLCDGLFTSCDGKLAYAEDGNVVYGAVAVDDGIIFSSVAGYVTVNGSCYVSSSSQDTTSGLANGSYLCDENGYIIANGFVTIGNYAYYFDNYEKVKGFTKIGDDYYMFNAGSGMMYTSTTMWVSANSYGIEAGSYYFQADGTMYVPDLENGVREIIEKDGNYYLTIDGVIQKDGLYDCDGEYYYAKANGVLAQDEVSWVSKTNDLVATKFYYAFGEDCKMVKTGFMTVPSTGYTYYYDDCALVKGFTQLGDDYYMFNAGSGMMYTDATMWVSTNSYGVAAGSYYFQADGTMYVPDLENGVREIIEKDGNYYLTIDGVIQKDGLYDCDGEYYYAKSNGVLAVDSVVYVMKTNDLVSKKFYYAFGKDGKMVKTGFMTVPSTGYTYYYDNCELVKGFAQIGDDYYMFNAGSGMMYTDTTLWISTNSYGVTAGSYYFGTDGKMAQ